MPGGLVKSSIIESNIVALLAKLSTPLSSRFVMIVSQYVSCYLDYWLCFLVWMLITLPSYFILSYGFILSAALLSLSPT